MSLSPELIAAAASLRRAKLEVKHAKERLMLELPEHVANDIHYNGRKANPGAEYTHIVAILTEVAE